MDNLEGFNSEIDDIFDVNGEGEQNAEEDIILTKNLQGEKETGEDIALNAILKFTNIEKKEEIREKLKVLGVKNISDLDVLQKHGMGLTEAFKDILDAVQISRLIKNLDDEKRLAEGIAIQLNPQLVDVHTMFSSKFINKLKGNEKLGKVDRKKMIVGLADELHCSYKSYNRKRSMTMANSMMTLYPRALRGCRLEKFASQISNHWKYLMKLDNKKKRQNLEVNNIVNDRAVLHSFTVKECFGIEPERDLPTQYPEGENSESQTAHKDKLLLMHSSGIINYKEVASLMEKTYVSQRATVNQKLIMEEILKQWPFFGKFSILETHFYHLVKLKKADFETHLNNIMPKLYKFFTSEGNKIEKGKKEKIPERIRNILICYDALGDSQSYQEEFMAIFQCLAIKMKVPLGSIFIYCDDTTTLSEIEASAKLPDDGTPRIAVLGDNLLHQPKCFVIVEKRAISSLPVTPYKAVLKFFMLFWVLKLLYPPKIAPLMQFMEKELYKIPGATGDAVTTSRVRREKGAKGWMMAPPPSLPKYLSCVTDFEDFCHMWKIA